MRLTISQIQQMKEKGEKIVMLTAYDYLSAKLIDEAGVDVILVGDSLGMVMLGYDSPIPVTMEEMLHHTKAVVRGSRRALVVGDMPFMTYQVEMGEAIRNAARFIQEGGAQAVKLEGGQNIAETVKRLVSCGIPVMGHIGLTPQYMHQLGDYAARGTSRESALRLLEDARALQAAGAFAIVLESVPADLATIITRVLAIPTIGVGAGPDCDGQDQVVSDILGLGTEFVPKEISKRYASLGDAIKRAISDYVKEIKAVTFPTREHSYPIAPEIVRELEDLALAD
ncbi:MAG TPA: 3-methyl-2-oxobutanoate hydroxymethyltransferase [Dehalococcoidia bacterium]|nr:3-methyl-2-oxobutanoate hydroxymethyltransferase [Dehalococcoidia bacterium]